VDEGGAIGDKVDGGVLGNRRQSLGTWDKARAVANLGRKEFYAPRAQGALKAARLYPSSNRIGRLNVTLAKFNSNSHRGVQTVGSSRCDQITRCASIHRAKPSSSRHAPASTLRAFSRPWR
jgi:hypothetical protein